MASPTPASTLVQGVVKGAVWPELKPHGFRKSGSTFRCFGQDWVHVLNVQSSSSNTALEARFTLNLGIFFPAADALADGLLGGHIGRDGPKEYECTVKVRIGSLLADGGDHWWEVRDGDATGAVEEQVRAAVRDVALPWLKRVSDPVEALKEAQLPARMVLSMMVGDLRAARELAEESLRSLPGANGLHAWARTRGLLA